MRKYEEDLNLTVWWTPSEEDEGEEDVDKDIPRKKNRCNISCESNSANISFRIIIGDMEHERSYSNTCEPNYDKTYAWQVDLVFWSSQELFLDTVCALNKEKVEASLLS